jgi:pimeloyl-ACP methyl ester carboxylesterase
MRHALLAALALVAAPFSGAQEMVTVASRPGVTQSFLIAPMGGTQPHAIALLFVGGTGHINLRTENGVVKFGARNFLPRSRAEWSRNAILPVVMDAPSDHGDLPDNYRTGEEQAADARAVIAELKRRYPGLPVYLVGTSRGTVSAAYLGRALGAEVAGVVLTSTMFRSRGRSQSVSLRGFDYSGISAPLLFVHHREDSCDVTPYSSAAELAARYPLVSVKGGKPPESSPCEPLSAHGFFGREPQTVDAIASWMLKRPFAKEIE